jgi:hypothetical protein
MAAKLICGICQATLKTGEEGRGVAIILCRECKEALKGELKQKIFQPLPYLPRPRAV